MAGSSGFNVNVPEPTTVQLEGNKTDVYERQQARREKDRRMQSLSDLAGRLLEGKGQTDGVSGPDGSIRQSADTYERITEQLETFYETPQETAGGLEQKVDSSSGVIAIGIFLLHRFAASHGGVPLSLARLYRCPAVSVKPAAAGRADGILYAMSLILNTPVCDPSKKRPAPHFCQPFSFIRTNFIQNHT